MAAECANFEVTRMARLLEVSTAGYYRWRAAQDRPPLPSEVRRADLDAKIISSHKASGGTYGSPGSPWTCTRPASLSAQNTVAARMASLGHRRGQPAAVQGHHQPRPERHLSPPTWSTASFHPDGLDELWTSDITYITRRRGRGLHVRHPRRGIVAGARVRRRRPHAHRDRPRRPRARPHGPASGQVAGTVFHTDRGSQFNRCARSLTSASLRPGPLHGGDGELPLNRSMFHWQ